MLLLWVLKHQPLRTHKHTRPHVHLRMHAHKVILANASIQFRSRTFVNFTFFRFSNDLNMDNKKRQVEMYFPEGEIKLT